MLGEVKLQEIRYGSLSCSHTNQWLVAALAGVKCDFEDISVGGKMSYELMSGQEGLKDALDKGMQWLVISAAAVAEHPTLPNFVQAAKNATGSAHSREDDFQLLKKIQAMAANMINMKGAVAWQVIANTVVRLSQCSHDDIAHLLLFAQKWGGGASTTFLDDLSNFHKAFVKPGRTVPASTWKALADLRVSADELCPFVVYAVVKAQAFCPSSNFDDKICKYVTVDDINSLAPTRKSEMLAAERVLSECRTLARTSRAPPEVCTKAIGKLDVFVAKLVLGKKDSKDKTVDDVVKQFSLDVGVARETPAVQSDTDLSFNVVQYDENGSPIGVGALALQSDGFKPGMTVTSTRDLEKGSYGLAETISMSDDGIVELKDVQTGRTEQASFDEFCSLYSKTTEKYEEFSGWQEHAPQLQDSYIDAVARSHVVTAISSIARTVDLPSLRVVKSPERAVFALDKYKVGKLQLVPETTVAKVVFDKKPGSLEGTVGDRAFYLLPTLASRDFAALAWGSKASPAAMVSTCTSC